jgi:hypothetical protein
MFDVSNGQSESSFGIAVFCCGPAVRGLEPKDQRFLLSLDMWIDD